MSFFNGYIFRRHPAIVLFILLIYPQFTDCQKSILDSTFTFRAGIVKTGNALDIITKQTGYNFTYDSRLVDAEAKTSLNFRDSKLTVVLDSILRNDSLVYSVIDKYIIISRADKPPSTTTDSISPEVLNYIN
jgi:hypothetical protein